MFLKGNCGSLLLRKAGEFATEVGWEKKCGLRYISFLWLLQQTGWLKTILIYFLSVLVA